MEVVDVPEPGPPGEGEVLVRPEAVGICGSDFHFFSGELEVAGDGSQYPRVQGHEVAATVEAVGPGCGNELAAGRRVAICPISSCGRCYPCRIGRENVCDNFRLIGIHEDGGLRELLPVPRSQVFPIEAGSAAVAAMAEPVSIAVRTVRRASVRPDERVVVLGAGPIGQAVSLIARDRGARPLVIDRVPRRLELADALGAETLAWTDAETVVAAVLDTTGGEGAPAVVDATGAPEAIRAAVDVAASAGRVVIVGMSHHEVPLRVGSFTERELDVLGVSCCRKDEFAEAVAFVERRGESVERLVTHEFPLERAPEALDYAMENPAEVVKAVVRGAGRS